MDRNVYLVSLMGQGDVNVAVVDKEVFEWLDFPFPPEHEADGHFVEEAFAELG